MSDSLSQRIVATTETSSSATTTASHPPLRAARSPVRSPWRKWRRDALDEFDFFLFRLARRRRCRRRRVRRVGGPSDGCGCGFRVTRAPSERWRGRGRRTRRCGDARAKGSIGWECFCSMRRARSRREFRAVARDTRGVMRLCPFGGATLFLGFFGIRESSVDVRRDATRAER